MTILSIVISDPDELAGIQAALDAHNLEFSDTPIPDMQGYAQFVMQSAAQSYVVHHALAVVGIRTAGDTPEEAEAKVVAAYNQLTTARKKELQAAAATAANVAAQGDAAATAAAEAEAAAEATAVKAAADALSAELAAEAASTAASVKAAADKAAADLPGQLAEAQAAKQSAKQEEKHFYGPGTPPTVSSSPTSEGSGDDDNGDVESEPDSGQTVGEVLTQQKVDADTLLLQQAMFAHIDPTMNMRQQMFIANAAVSMANGGSLQDAVNAGARSIAGMTIGTPMVAGQLDAVTAQKFLDSATMAMNNAASPEYAPYNAAFNAAYNQYGATYSEAQLAGLAAMQGASQTSLDSYNSHIQSANKHLRPMGSSAGLDAPISASLAKDSSSDVDSSPGNPSSNQPIGSTTMTEADVLKHIKEHRAGN